ncbi:MAG: agmatinase [Candidatus Aminicenantes bacterium RBG_13_59_9]|nr:MAG: agmatinase [Candidatus Aminicenantes bacterium RBG_13_59_9]OGD39513.1 MAG: agmatinase [Candidatus Aminicenantes bacterium RBG_19FT_COMBO_58_17]
MTDFGGAIQKSDDYRIAVLGVPYDAKSSYLRGAALGPKAIREASTGLSTNEITEKQVNLERDTVMVDLGDVNTEGDYDRVAGGIQAALAPVLARGAAPIVLGGDHSVTYPVVKALSRIYPALDILHFDAHPDLYDELYDDRYSHACTFARIMEEELARTLVQVGIRAASPPQRDNARKYGVRLIEMKDLPGRLALTFRNPLFISFDMDALDPAFAPGVSHHEAGGLTTRQAIDIIHRLRARVVGLDVVELNPARDPLGITAAAAFKIIKETAAEIVLGEKRRTHLR